MAMKSIAVILLALFLMISLISNVGIVLADDDDDNSGSSDNSGSGSNSESDSDRSNSGSSDSNDNSEDDDSNSDDDDDGNSGSSNSDRKRTKIIDENGNKIEVRTETKIKDGREETIEKRKITRPDGTEVTLKTKSEMREGRERVTNSIQVKGTEVTTKLTVREEQRGEQSRLKAKLSTGIEQDILVLPDEAMVIALEELKAGGIKIELSEFIDGDERRAVFSARTNNPGKFLGLFNTEVDLETLIDTETGEVIQTNRPWWAFLVVGQDKTDICHIPDGDVSKRRGISVAVPSVKAHLEHGDSLGLCATECGDGILVEGVEVCDDGNLIDGDGCSSVCEIETITPPDNEIAPAPTTP